MKPFTIIFLFLSILSVNGQPSWQFTNGPYGGKINALSSNNNVIIASTSLGRIYKSIDEGINWSPSNVGLPNDDVITCLANINSVFFAGTFEHGIYRSGIDGDGWTAINTGINGPQSKVINALAVNGNKLLVSTGEGVYITFNNGNLWTKVNNGLNDAVLSLGISGDTLFAGTLYGGLYISNNNGGNWVKKSISFPWTNVYITSIHAEKDTVYIGVTDDITLNSRIFFSSDRGENWVEIFDIPTSAEIVTSFIRYKSEIIASTNNGIWRSNDGGFTWQNFNNGLSNNSIRSLSNSLGTLIAATSNDGIFVFVDSLNLWIPMNNGLNNIDCFSLGSDENNLYVGTKGGGMLMRDSTAESWRGINSGLTIDYDNYTVYLFGLQSFGKVTSIEEVDSSLFVAADRNVYYSDDDGAHWSIPGTGFPTQVTSVRFIKESEDILYAGTDFGVWKSSDNGVTWEYSSSGISAGADINSIEVIGNNVFAAGTSVYWSFNQGANWASLAAFGIVNQLKQIGDYLYACSNNGLYRSNDLGNSWTDVGLSKVRAITSFGSTIIVGTELDGVFYSRENGAWISVNHGLPQDFIVNDLLSVGPNIYLATEKHGVWSLDSTELEECAFSSIEILEVGSCNVDSNKYELKLIISYNSTADGDIQILIDGVPFVYTTIGSGIDTFSVFPNSNGMMGVDLEVRSSDDLNCSIELSDAFNAPVACDSITSIIDPIKLGIIVAPNPFLESIRIAFDSGEAEFWDFYIVDMYGRNIANNIDIYYLNSNIIDVEFKDTPTGIYFLSLINEKRKTCFRVIKL